MAASMTELDFESWISSKLQSLNVDDEVFGNYIISLLDTEDTSREEKIEAISGILVEVEVFILTRPSVISGMCSVL